ncbi:MAG: phosphate ABC transporter permease subunit PstC [Candidatus Geothermincolia bacterium]
MPDREWVIEKTLFIFSMMAVLGIILVIVFIARESIPALREVGPGNIFLSARWDPNVADPSAGQYGILVPVVGTLATTLGALIIGTPLAIGTAIFLAEIAPPRTAKLVTRGVELLAGIPSVVFGWIGLIILVPGLARLTGTQGYGILAASVILGIMIIPTITTIARDALEAVPDEYRQGSAGLGATRWQTIRRVQLPAARNGLLVAVILGMGRAIGETMAVQLVIGNARQFPTSLTSVTSTLTSRIVTDMGESSGAFRSVLFVQGLVLLVIAMLIILLIRRITRTKVMA